MRSLLLFAAAAVFVAQAGAASAAELSPAELLQAVDTALPRAAECEGTLTIAEAGSTRTYTYTLKRVDDARELLFVAPNDIKGMKYLALGSESLFVYLPAFNKQRGLRPEEFGKPFFDSLLSLADVLELPFADRWTAVRANEFPGGKALALKPKDATAPSPNLILETEDRSRWIRRESRHDYLPTERHTEKKQVCTGTSVTYDDLAKERLRKP